MCARVQHTTGRVLQWLNGTGRIARREEIFVALHIVVIGGGPAGIGTARTAALHGAQVTLVTERPLAQWHKLLPSRAWLAACSTASHPNPSLPAAEDLSATLPTVHALSAAWSQQHAAEFQHLGITVVLGRAMLRNLDEVVVRDSDGTATVLHADRLMLATGFDLPPPPPLTPRGLPVFTPNTLAQLPSSARTLVLIGDGPIGYEFASILRAFHHAVTWLVAGDAPSCRVIPEADDYLNDMLVKQGVQIVGTAHVLAIKPHPKGVSAECAGGRSFPADAAVLAFANTGAAPLDLTVIGLPDPFHEPIPVNDYGQTALGSVYVVGDARRPQAANLALAEGRVAALHALGLPVAPIDRCSAIVAFHQHPQVARVGKLASDDPALQTITIPYGATLATHLAGAPDGRFTLAWDAERRVVGGLAIGIQAADALAPVALTIATAATIDDLAALVVGHPSVAELSVLAAQWATASRAGAAL
jgi:dihydrolipoamide dehydrogenase